MTPTRVLHVLPHAGAGAQTYIDTLTALEGFSFGIFELTPTRSPAAAAANMALRRPSLWRAARRADLVHVHGEMASLCTLALLARRPSVVTLHGLHLLRRLAPGLPARLGHTGLTAVIAAADATICVSEAERNDLSWLPAGMRAKLAVVRNGLALPPPPDPDARARARAALDLPDSAVAVLYAGQLEPRKGPLTALRAVQRVHASDPRVTLLVAGTGPSEAELRSAAGDETRLLGQRSDIPRLLAAADVFVMPSHREGLSYAVLEAMGHGVATVVSDGPGNPEAVGDAGVVFAVGDVDGLAAALTRLAADPPARAALARAGRARIATELSAARMVAETGAVYDAVLRGPGRPGGARPA
ncbi:MAG TPA: glycosyltransferase family 4 protein [Solirubrobacteraceae bacterium]|nr:glycosyltransferase family 4 protein [Solirubrobacteraceae bacterium]